MAKNHKDSSFTDFAPIIQSMMGNGASVTSPSANGGSTDNGEKVSPYFEKGVKSMVETYETRRRKPVDRFPW